MKFFEGQRTGRSRAMGIFVLVCLLMITLGTGCDEEGTYEVKLEEARMAIDDGDYSTARSILVDLPQTAEVKEALSNTIAGEELNLDMFNIILTMDSLDEEGETGSIDMIGLLIGDENDQIDVDTIFEKLASATEAIELYKDIAELESAGDKHLTKDIAELESAGIENLTMDQKLQLGLLCITRIILSVGKLISDELPAGELITLTEAWIRANRDDFTSLTPSDSELEMFAEDLACIGYAIDAISATNDLRDDYEEFIGELDSNGDGETTADELNAYIANM